MSTRKSWFPLLVDLPSGVIAVCKAFRMCVSWWLTQLCTRYTHENWNVHNFPVFSPRLQFYYFKIKQHSKTLPLKSLTFFSLDTKGIYHILATPTLLHAFRSLGSHLHELLLAELLYHQQRSTIPCRPFLGDFLRNLILLLIWRVPPSDRL